MRIGILYPLPLSSNNKQKHYFKEFIKKKIDSHHTYYYLNIWGTPTSFFQFDDINIQNVNLLEFAKQQNYQISTKFIYKTYLQYKEYLNTNPSRLGNLRSNIFQNSQYRIEIEKYLFLIMKWIKEYGIQTLWCLDMFFLKFLEELSYTKSFNIKYLTQINNITEVYLIKDINYHINTNVFSFKEILECINSSSYKFNEPFSNIIIDDLDLYNYFLKSRIHTKYYCLNKTITYNNLINKNTDFNIPNDFTDNITKLLTLLLTYQKCNSIQNWDIVSNNYQELFKIPIEFNVELPTSIYSFISSIKLKNGLSLFQVNSSLQLELQNIMSSAISNFNLITKKITSLFLSWCQHCKIRLIPEKELPKIIFQLKLKLITPDVKLNYSQLGKYIDISNILHTELNNYITKIYQNLITKEINTLDENLAIINIEFGKYGNFKFEINTEMFFNNNNNILLNYIGFNEITHTNNIKNIYNTHLDKVINNLKTNYDKKGISIFPINIRINNKLGSETISQPLKNTNIVESSLQLHNYLDNNEEILILENDETTYANNVSVNKNNSDNNVITIGKNSWENNNTRNLEELESILSLQDIEKYTNNIKKPNKLIDNVNKTNKELDSKMIYGYQFMFNCQIIDKEYCNYVKKIHSGRNKDNLFRFEPDIYIQSNPHLKTDNIYQHYYLKGIIDGFIMSRKQILKWYPDVLFSKINNKLHLNYKSNSYLLAEFVKKFIYEKKLKWFLTNGIKLINKKTNTKHFKLVLFLQIGNNEIGNIILDNILKNINITDFCLCVNFVNYLTTHTLYTKLVNKIKSNFENYIITTSIDFGTDITPFLLQYYILNTLNIDYEYVLKLHTKSDTEWRGKMINIFLDGNLDKLLCIMDNNLQIGMVGNEEYLMDDNDVFCKDILNNYFKDLKFKFIGGTCFLTRKLIIDKTFNLDKKILKKLLLMNYYYDNYLFFNNSLIHSYERIFGCICYQNNKYILGINNYNQVPKCLIYASHIYSKNINDLQLMYQYLNFFNKYVNKLVFVYSIDNTIDLTNNIFFNKILIIKNIIIKEVDNIGRDLYKYKYAMEFVNNLNLPNNTKYILTNDSYYLKHNPLDYFYLINYCNTFDFIGFIDSKEFLYHYQSFLWCFNDNIKNYLKSNITYDNLSTHELIYNNEIKLSNYIINNYKSITYYKNIESITQCANINFSHILFDLYKIFKYPILKKRALFKIKNETTLQLWKNNNNSTSYYSFLKNLQKQKYLPANFNYNRYKELNEDLPKDWNEQDCINHYINYGLIERRLYD